MIFKIKKVGLDFDLKDIKTICDRFVLLTKGKKSNFIVDIKK